MVSTQCSSVRGDLFRFFIAGHSFEKVTSNHPVMPSGIIDEEWHKLLLDETTYRELTTSTTGMEIEHLESKGIGYLDWVPYYESMFGKLSENWFTDKNGALDSKAYNEYLKTGKIYAAWDCTPGFKPPKVERPIHEKVEGQS